MLTAIGGTVVAIIFALGLVKLFEIASHLISNKSEGDKE